MAILIGEYEKNPEMLRSLINYVQNGGTLLLNVKQLQLGFSEEFVGIKVGEEFTDNDYRFNKLLPLSAKICKKMHQKTHFLAEIASEKVLLL